MDPIFETILKNTYTQSQFKHRLRILKSFVSQKLFGGQDSQLNETDLAWIKTLPEAFFQNFTKDNCTDYFKAVEERLANTPSLMLNIAFEPNDEALSEIGQFTRTNFTSFKLLDFKYDPSVIAGCVLNWKGISKDYSVREAIEEKKEVLLESFKKFLR